MHEAYLFTLSSLVSMVNLGLIQKLYSELKLFIDEKMQG